MKIISFIVVLGVFICGAFKLTFASNIEETQLPARFVETTVAQLSDVLDKNYVYPEMAQQMNAYLKQQFLAGKYDDSRTHRELVKQMQTDLRQVSDDGHISLLLSEDSVDRTTVVVPLTEEQSKIHAEVVSDNITSNIGYLQINTFGSAEKTNDGLVKGMESIGSSDFLIIDLRENRGGDPNMVALLSSYFVEDNSLLWSIVDRNGEQQLEVRSASNRNKFKGGLCILTSRKTYSAAEAFAYTMKHAGRALIVGERTGGGAHLVDMMRINDKVDMRVPVARAYNHITDSNWERVGVVPDIIVKATDAKEAAIEYFNNEVKL